MLGFSPVSSRAISGSPFSLVLIAASIAATGTLAFSGTAQWGAFNTIRATGSLTFSGSAVWSSLNALTGTGTIAFGGDGTLRIAGRPFVFFAAPDRLTFVSTPERLVFNGQANAFTFRGMR